MSDRLIMSKKERRRKTVLDQVLEGVLRKKDARIRLGLSARQFRRIYTNYREKGDEALVHKGRGKASPHAYSLGHKNRVLEAYREKYMGFGPTLSTEYLEENEKLKVHPETLRLWLKEAGLWEPRRKRKAHRKQRERRARYGELLQLDGSIHAWLPNVEGKQCLMNMVDDATGKTLALMDSGETTRAAFALLRWWIKEAGIPLAVYVDLKSLYVSPKTLKKEETSDEVEAEWLTHFSKACKKLGIEVIKAYSAQAKGRVERSHGVYQDRLVKELKIKGIQSIEEANHLLSSSFVNKLNRKFVKEPADPADAHVPLLGDEDLEQIFCWEESRQIRNDWTIQYKSQYYQLGKSANVRPKQYVTVRHHLDDSISIWFENTQLEGTAIEKPEQKTAEKTKKGVDSVARSKQATLNRHKTSWGRFNPDWLNPKREQEKKAATSESV